MQSGHFGSALAAAGELAWRRGNYDQAIGLLEKALMVTQSRFGESDACAVIRQNLEMIKKEKEEKGITGAADKKGRQGRKPEPLCELSVQGCEILRQDKKKSFFEKFSDGRFDKKRARNTHEKKILKIEKT
ncbi:MAG: tetratricopeptide repeat protein [Clostridium fessum]